MNRDIVYWVVPDPIAAAKTAGFRIRVKPLVDSLNMHGIPVEVIGPLDMARRMDELTKTAQAVVLSKPNDTLSYLCMRILDAHGVKIAIDLFDNYFSWSPALMSRDVHWQWLRNLSVASLVITSTPYLRRVVETLFSGPVIEISDPLPSPAFTSNERKAINHKWPLKGRVELLWFGISANPFYPAGLSDLNDWAPVLQELRDRLAADRELRLTICTNNVPAVLDTLTLMRRVGVDARYVEWTDEGCSALMACSHGVLLPTNLTGFSLSKTHNRCSDALVRRCLVLASPRGPYEHIGDAVFRDVPTFVQALETASVDADLVQRLTSQSLTTLKEDGREHNHVELLATTLAQPIPSSPAKLATASAARILVVGRIRVDALKVARTVNYLTAGFTGHGVKATLDFSLALADPDNEDGSIATIALSPKAWDAATSALALNASMDVFETDSQLTCRSQRWRLVFDKALRICAVRSIGDDRLMQRLDVARLVTDAVPHEEERWYDRMVELMVRTLQQIGFCWIDYGADEGGGWPAFARSAQPELGALEERLRTLWERNEGAERDWTHFETEVTQ